MENKNVTVKDVAALAKVAPSTVSLVLNNSSKVKSETREKVLNAVKELNYIPNNFAVSLRQNVTSRVGIILPDLHNTFYLDIVKGIKNRCNIEDIPIYVGETRHKLEEEEVQIQILRGAKANKLIFIGTSDDEHLIEPLKGLNKIVYIDKVDKNGEIPSIMIDNYKSSYDACKYLINKGCRNIYYINQRVFTKPLIDRENGVIDCLKDNNLNYSNASVHINEMCFNKLESGYMAMKHIIENYNPDGIIATSDQIAMGAIRFLYENEIKVPDDISVIGFDNIDISKFCTPSLTTISQPREKMGELAFSLLMGNELIDNSNKNFILNHDFIVRESTR